MRSGGVCGVLIAASAWLFAAELTAGEPEAEWQSYRSSDETQRIHEYKPEPLPDLKPGERPALDSDEAGLWMVMDRVEEALRRSGRVVDDPALNAYLRRIVCRLAPDYCDELSIYVVRTPHFNATMAPNGVMQVWTGLLLRCQNEAQLAYILGHEIAHYRRRHSVQNWRNATQTADAMAFVQLFTSAAGVGFVGALAQLAGASAIFAYGRDQEREADELGLQMLIAAGYDPREAAKSWHGLMLEREADPDSEDKPIFFASHPPTEERVETLEAKAAAADVAGSEIGADRFAEAVRPLRAAWLEDELKRRRLEQSEVLLRRLAEADASGELRFYQGEIHRLRRTDDDNRRAIDLYLQALDGPNAPAETHRSLGFVYWDTGENDRAADAFRTFLSLQPDAGDAAMIQSYIDKLDKD